MANTTITPSIIAKETLMQVENNIVMGKLVHREYKREFVKVGDTVSVRKPVKFVASDGATRVNQDVQEASTPFIINKRKHVSWGFNTNDLTLSIEEYSDRYIKPAAIAIANQIDSDLTLLYKKVAQYVGTAGTTPTTFANLGAPSVRLDNAACQGEDRRLVMNPEASFNVSDMLKGLYNPEMAKGAVRSRSMGPIANMDTYMDQNIRRHTVGTWGTTPLVNGAAQSVTYAAAGHTYGSTSQTLAIDALTITTGTCLEGDRFTIANVFAVNPVSRETLSTLQEFVVQADATANGSGQATITISPAIITTGPFQTVNAAPADNAAITRVSTNYVANMAFHKNAFGLVMCPLELPDGAAFKARESHNGYSFRVVKDYDIETDTDVIRIDALYGVKALYPELACLLLG